MACLQNRLVHHENGARRVMERGSCDGTALMRVTGTDNDEVGVRAPRDCFVRLCADEHGMVPEPVERRGSTRENVRVVRDHAVPDREFRRGVEDPQRRVTPQGEVRGVPQHPPVTGATADQHGDVAVPGVDGLGRPAHDDRVAARRGRRWQDVATQPRRRGSSVPVADDHQLGAEVVLWTMDLEAGADELGVGGGPPQHGLVTPGAVLDDHDWFHA